MQKKVTELIERKKEELNLEVVKHQYSSNGDIHVHCKRSFDDKHVVWTSYWTGEIRTSYNDFYNGTYLEDIKQAELEFIKRTIELEENSQVILMKNAEIEVINAPRKICFKEFAYPQLDVTIIELLYLDQKFAVLIDEEGLYNEWESQHIISKGNQVVAHFVGNGMIVDVDEEGEINSLTDEALEKFHSLYVIK